MKVDLLDLAVDLGGLGFPTRSIDKKGRYIYVTLEGSTADPVKVSTSNVKDQASILRRTLDAIKHRKTG